MTTATGLQLLISESRGVYIPQHFAQDFDLPAFGLAEDDEDVAILRSDPDHEHYWDAWDAVMDKAKTAEGGYLHQDGDLWLVHPHLMDNEEYINFFGENPPVPDGWTDYRACTPCVMYIANADLSGLVSTDAPKEAAKEAAKEEPEEPKVRENKKKPPADEDLSSMLDEFDD